MRFTLKGKDAICNLCGIKMVGVGERNGARCLKCPKCGYTFMIGKRVKDSALFPTKKRRKRGEEDAG